MWELLKESYVHLSYVLPYLRNCREVLEPHDLTSLEKPSMDIGPHFSSNSGRFFLHNLILIFIRLSEGPSAPPVWNMVGNAMWRCNKEPCHYSTFKARVIKEDVETQRCELETKKGKFAQFEAKLEEHNQRHDKETTIILRVVNKHARQIHSLRQGNQEICRTSVQHHGNI